MAAPNVQICTNDEVVKVMCSKDITGAYSFFNLYWSTDSGMAGEAAIASNIPNVPDTYYSKEHVTYAFRRSAIGVSNTAEFYVRLKGVSAGGVEDAANPGATRLIPSLTAQREEYNATQIYGYDYTKGLWKRVKVGDDGTLA
jgi:hypothetical protein